MKPTNAVYIAVVAAVLTVGAQARAAINKSEERGPYSTVVATQSVDFVRAEKAYTVCLQSENIGVVESGLAHIAMMKLTRPEKEFKKVQRQVEIVAAEYPSLEIRYKAYLVSTLLSAPGLFTEEGNAAYASPDEVFEALAIRMQRMIAGNIGK